MPDKKLGPKDIEGILHELKDGLAGLYGDRLVSVILYGSYARGEATEDSDIDVAVVLKGEVAPGAEIDRMVDLLTELDMKYGSLTAVCPVSADDMGDADYPFFLNVRREGLSL
ncbi:MAG: nucleotidyltransferase domain-containing protein [Deltaproteobacteria bacterium]|nr:nucleotidyltransferase domain-containing protein [Deltaproteobacteria bacterium]